MAGLCQQFFFQFNIFSQQKAEWAPKFKFFETTRARQDSTEAFLNHLDFKLWQAKKILFLVTATHRLCVINTFIRCLAYQIGLACEMLVTNASPVCPDKVLPLLSTIVPDTTIGTLQYSFSNSC